MSDGPVADGPGFPDDTVRANDGTHPCPLHTTIPRSRDRCRNPVQLRALHVRSTVRAW